MKIRLTWIIAAAVLATALGVAQAQDASAPYKNPSLSSDERVKDLLGRMTLEEKVAQLGSTWQNRGYPLPESAYFVDAKGQLDVAKAKAALKNGLGEFSRPSEAVAGANHAQVAGPAAGKFRYPAGEGTAGLRAHRAQTGRDQDRELPGRPAGIAVLQPGDEARGRAGQVHRHGGTELGRRADDNPRNQAVT